MSAVTKGSRLGFLCLLFVILSPGCSAQKYDSWSECWASETAVNANAEAVRIYCDSNYQKSVDEKQVIQDIASEEFYRKNKIKRPPPEIGLIEDGYRFKGGDPANPSNWEPVE